MSNQAWGATLDNEWNQLSQNILDKVSRVAIFEMPGLADEINAPIPKEEALKNMGLDLDIIDHHHYKWVDRYCTTSSLEQLCHLIGWNMNRDDTAIAVNDRSYIAGLKSMKLSNDEIRKIRTFDLLCQGNSASYIDRNVQQAINLIPTLEKKRRGDLWILDEPSYKQPFIVQELSLNTTSGLVHAFEIKPHKLGFSGCPNVVNALLDHDFSQWEAKIGSLITYGGGDGVVSKFWGLKLANNQKNISRELADHVLKLVESTLGSA